jgi:ectoine hydroxylase-related dioxygenase (phytanoyl-CoA dioxygenase family)
MTHDKGPTEFGPGSHIDFDIKAASTTPVIKAGQALLFDYRVKHRGLGNRSTEERPLLYITYARPFWVDVYNFDRKRYSSLPMVEQRGSRDERMQKRQKS